MQKQKLCNVPPEFAAWRSWTRLFIKSALSAAIANLTKQTAVDANSWTEARDAVARLLLESFPLESMRKGPELQPRAPVQTR